MVRQRFDDRRRGRMPRKVVALSLGLCAAAGAASAQLLPTGSLVPETGSGSEVTVRPGDLAAALPGSGPNWTVTPAIGLQEEWTNNALNSGNATKSSFITVITPSLLISGESARFTGTLNYAPSIYYYTSVSGQNQVAQNLNATTHVTLVPDQVFLDVNAFAGQQSLNPGTAPQGTAAVNRNELVQTYNVSATPYVTHRFGGWGTAQIGATASETTQSALNGNLPGVGSGAQTLQTLQGAASFNSGENFGRFLSNLQLLAATSTGTGPTQNNTRDTATYTAGYAITRTITALGSIGWEKIDYTGASNYYINDATWGLGFKLTPNADSNITVMYGRQDGATALWLNGVYKPSPRITLFANYSVGITTATEQLQNTLAGAQVDANGNPVDAVTGAPLQLNNNFFGTTVGLFEARSGSLTAAYQLDRDNFQVTVNYLEQTPVGTQTVAVTNNTGTYGSLAWTHQLSAALQGRLFGQYGVSRNGSGASEITTRPVVGSAGLNYTFSPSLNGWMQYSYTSGSNYGSSSTSAASLVVVGVNKTF